MFKTVFAGAMLAAASVAGAAQVYNGPVGLSGNQNWTGNLGLDFQVVNPVRVTQLGAFDSLGDGFQRNIQVGLFNAAGTLLASASFGQADGTGSPYVFKSIAPLVLTAGNYQLTAIGYGDGELNYNAGFVSSLGIGAITFNNLGGKLVGLGTRYDGASVLQLAGSTDVGIARYGAGSMIAGSVPEPASWALLIAGFGLVGATARRRRTAVAA